tara:strand:- start:307 stop:540 length:234 start_codon:yes stop_codon:yes gene_type:complete
MKGEIMFILKTANYIQITALMVLFTSIVAFFHLFTAKAIYDDPALWIASIGFAGTIVMLPIAIFHAKKLAELSEMSY